MRLDVATFLISLSGLLSTSEADADVTVIALTGQSAPGTNAGVFGDVISVPSLNNAGSVALSANSSAGSGVWLYHGDGVGELVALGGQQAPGTDDGVFFGTFGNTARTLVLSERDDVSFHATLTGNISLSFPPDVTGVWAKRSQQPVALVARSAGIVSPEFADGGFSFFDNARFFLSLSRMNPVRFGPSNPFGPLRVDGSGNTAFLSGVSGGTIGFGQTVLFTEADSGNLEIVVRSDTRAPGAASESDFFSPTDFPIGNDSEFFGMSSPAVNRNGRIAFSATLFRGPSTRNSGLWTTRDGTGIQPVAVPGQQAPGFDEGQVFEFVGRDTRLSFLIRERLESPGFNNSGHIVFSAFVDGPGVPRETGFEGFLSFPDNEGIWVDRGNGPLLIARKGQAAPGITGEITFQSASLTLPSGEIFFDFFSEAFARPVLAGDGTIAFAGRLGGDGVTQANDWGLWRGTNSDDVELVVREGDHAPGLGDEVFIHDLPLEFGNGEALQRFRTGAREVTSFSPEPTAAINAHGRIAFSATLTGPGFEPELVPTTDFDRGRGIWAEDLNGELQLIAYTGGVLDISGDGTDLRTIDLLGFAGSSGNQDGMSSGFNDRGQLAFFATFTDGTSGVFVSNLVAVPEPGSLGLITLCVLLIPRRAYRATGKKVSRVSR